MLVFFGMRVILVSLIYIFGVDASRIARLRNASSAFLNTFKGVYHPRLAFNPLSAAEELKNRQDEFSSELWRYTKQKRAREFFEVLDSAYPELSQQGGSGPIVPREQDVAVLSVARALISGGILNLSRGVVEAERGNAKRHAAWRKLDSEIVVAGKNDDTVHRKMITRQMSTVVGDFENAKSRIAANTAKIQIANSFLLKLNRFDLGGENDRDGMIASPASSRDVLAVDRLLSESASGACHDLASILDEWTGSVEDVRLLSLALSAAQAFAPFDGKARHVAELLQDASVDMSMSSAASRVSKSSPSSLRNHNYLSSHGPLSSHVSQRNHGSMIRHGSMTSDGLSVLTSSGRLGELREYLKSIRPELREARQNFLEGVDANPDGSEDGH